MKRIVVVLLVVLSLRLTAQEVKQIRVEFFIVDELSLNPLSDVVVALDSLKLQVKTNHKGIARMQLPINGNYLIRFYKPTYAYETRVLAIGELPVSIDTIVLKSNPIELELLNTIDTSLESFFDGVEDSQSAYLSIGREVFDRKSAFDWGSSFFNRRGLGSSSRKVLINGIQMNRLVNGRALWGQWGGLNDFVRNQELTSPLEVSAVDFSKGLGVTSIDLNPFGMRTGKRLTSSISDKSYQGRVMVSLVEQLSDSFRVAIGGSIRFGNRGYKAGTPYEAYAYAAHIAKQWTIKNRTSLHFFASDQKTAKSSALTKEVAVLLGRDYNPNWGAMGAHKRSAKQHQLSYKTVLMTHTREGDASHWSVSAMAQQGYNERTRLHYDTAESPNPVYYKKLPSYYINGFLGANFYAAQSASNALLNAPQLAWDEFFSANTLHPEFVHYALIADVEEQHRLTGMVNYQSELFKGLVWNSSLSINHENYSNYARAKDLLSGTQIRDFNPFDFTLNDLEGSFYKQEGDQIQYVYDSSAHHYGINSFLTYQSNRWMISMGAQLSHRIFSRERRMINQRFEQTPLLQKKYLKGNQLVYSMRYAFDARNYMEAHWTSLKEPASLDQYFVNPQENNRVLTAEDSYELGKLSDLTYVMRWKTLEGRISAYYYRFNQQVKNASYYIHSTYGSVFVRSLITDQSTLHKGIEGSIKLKLSSVVELESALALGHFSYANNPKLSLELTDPIGIEGVPIIENRMDLGQSQLKNYRLGKGPQSAFSLSISYRDPNYWFSSLSFNRMAENYIEPAAVRFTESFLLDKESFSPAPLLPNELKIIKKQERLAPYFITNLLFGKSYLKNGIYSSIFLSVDNLLAADFTSGGYESSRYGNYRDYLNDQLTSSPLFGTHYWWSSSRRFFLNLSISFP